MTASNIQITAGSGTRLATNSYTEGAVTVHDEKFIPGEYPYASYVVSADAVSIATANDHVLTINAGASLNVRIRRIFIKQAGNASAASARSFEIMRTTTGAPSGGTAVTPARYNTGDSASGATAMTLPSTKGTESTILYYARVLLRQAILATGAQADDYWEWYQKPNQGPIIILAGTTNGIAVKSPVATAGASLQVTVEFVETAF